MNYTVRSRDTLTAIARRFDTTVDALVNTNHLRRPNDLRAGQQLNIPGQRDEFTASVTASLSAPAETTCPTRPPVAASVAPAPPALSFWDRLVSSFDHVTGQPGVGEAVTQAGQGDVHLTVPFYPQSEAGHGFTPGRRACFRAASQMATDAGGNVSAVADRIEIATGEDRRGRITVNADRATLGRAHIDAELEAGRPVVVGVSHKDARYNADHITDHFVTITGRGTDEQGRTYYSFNDPGTRAGADTDPRNRFYVDPSNGLMYRPEDPLSTGLASHRYEVAMVR